MGGRARTLGAWILAKGPDDQVDIGTETADKWVGYVDGAIRSGERAAKDVQARL